MKKMLFLMVGLMGTIALLSAQDKVVRMTSDTIFPKQETCEAVPLSKWSIQVFAGLNDYRLAPEAPSLTDKLNLSAGGSLDYTINPLAGISLEYTYGDFSRPFDWQGTRYHLDATANDVVLYTSLNLMNAFLPFRDGFWDYVNIYGNLGGGLSFYTSQSTITTKHYNDECWLGMLGLDAELLLSKTISLDFGAQYRQYETLMMSGISTSHRNADAFIGTIGLRYKLGVPRLNHARNTNLCDFTPKPSPVIVNTKYTQLDTDETIGRLKSAEGENSTLKKTIQQLNDEVKKLKDQAAAEAAKRVQLEQQNNERTVTTSKLEDKLQKLETDLKQLSTQKEGVVNLSLETIKFQTGSNKLAPGSSKILDQIAGILKNNSFWSELKVIGHTDDVGTASSNQRLSELRALAVKEYLLLKGVPDNIIAIGMGEAQPVDSNKTPEGRQNNRRVEFEISK